MANKRQNAPVGTQRQSKQETGPIQARPRICLIDVEPDSVASLQAEGFNCHSGTLGQIVEVPNRKHGDTHRLNLNCSFPRNLHEYDIVVIDLQSQNKVPYINKEHVLPKTKQKEISTFCCSYPQTIFDPRPISAGLLGVELRPLMEKESILVVFAAEEEKVQYERVSVGAQVTYCAKPESWSLYSFYSQLPEYAKLVGRDTAVVFPKYSPIRTLLEKHNSEATYHIVFKHPERYDPKGYKIKDVNFHPLMAGGLDHTVAFMHVREKSTSFFFPRIERKKEFLLDLVRTVLPQMFPLLFPYSTQFGWLEDVRYRVPNEQALLTEKRQIQREYEGKLREIDRRINMNREEYSFLHDLITQSGDALVKTVEIYLDWLGFNDVVNVDETEPELKEEDLRVEAERGLLVIEVKGIAGTSTDSECSQISKIKYRRAEERKRFDVFGLYLVNHQRFLPPENRANPPFNDVQIQDATNDKRGLLTTYDLFKLYFNISNGYISKEAARNALFEIGLVEFRPSGATEISRPYKIHHNGTVVVFQFDGILLSTGMSLILDDAGRYRSASILEIRVNDVPVDEVSSGEVGIRLSEKVLKSTKLWISCRD